MISIFSALVMRWPLSLLRLLRSDFSSWWIRMLLLLLGTFSPSILMAARRLVCMPGRNIHAGKMATDCEPRLPVPRPAGAACLSPAGARSGACTPMLPASISASALPSKEEDAHLEWSGLLQQLCCPQNTPMRLLTIWSHESEQAKARSKKMTTDFVIRVLSFAGMKKATGTCKTDATSHV